MMLEPAAWGEDQVGRTDEDDFRIRQQLGEFTQADALRHVVDISEERIATEHNTAVGWIDQQRVI